MFHCVEATFGAASGGTPRIKNGAPRDELKSLDVSNRAILYLYLKGVKNSKALTAILLAL